MRTFSTLGSIAALTLAGLVGCSDAGGSPPDQDADAGHHGSGGGGGDVGAGGGGGGGGGDVGTGGGGGGGMGDPLADGGMGDEDPGDGGGTTDPGPTPHEGFYHPGILVNQAMLDFVKAKVEADAEPWASAFDEAAGSWYGSLSYTPHARGTVQCGSYSNPDIGCSDEKNDSLAAYTHALLWYYTGDEDHAQKAIEIMNDWSYTITEHTDSNAPLQSAWVAEVFPRAAEIIRYTYSGWSAADVEQFETMLDEVYLPMVINGSGSNGNWELSMIEATINIGVFNDDQETFDKGVSMWRERVPAYIYMSTDGPTPMPPPRGNKTGDALIGFWYNQTTFVDGLSQETCRDLGHVQYGLAAIINAAETARIQDVDLYGEEQERIRDGLGFHAKYLNGAAVPDWLCGGSLTDVTPDPMWEIGFNHYSTTLGYAMTQTGQLTHSIRPTGATHHMAWETLTHGDIGGVGLP